MAAPSWALQSLDHYVQECGAVLAEQNLAPRERADVQYAARMLPEVLDEAETLLPDGPSAVPPEVDDARTLLTEAWGVKAHKRRPAQRRRPVISLRSRQCWQDGEAHAAAAAQRAQATAAGRSRQRTAASDAAAAAAQGGTVDAHAGNARDRDREGRRRRRR